MKTSLKLALAMAVAVAVPAAVGAATAEENWKVDCLKCHGPDGAAKGPMGVRLKLKDYTDPAVNAAMTDEEIVTAIKDGIKNDKGVQTMPAYANKYSPEDVEALRLLIRGFAKKE